MGRHVKPHNVGLLSTQGHQSGTQEWHSHCCALTSCLSFDNFLHLSEPQFPIYKVDLLILDLQGCWKESVLQTEVQTG